MFGPFQRFAARWPATLVFGGLLVVAVGRDFRFFGQSERGRGVIRSVTAGGRSGITFAEVDRLDADGPERAELRTWYTPLAPGQVVSVRVSAADRRVVVLDRPWDLFWPSGAALLVTSVAFLVEGSGTRPRRCARRDGT